MTYLKPLPQTTVLNAPFWEGLRSHEFRVPRCQSCGDLSWVPYPACRTCLSEDQEWTTVSGEATVWSWSVVHRDTSAFALEVPYVVVLAKLVEEPQPCIVTANLVDADLEAISIGMPIKAVYEDLPEEDITVFRFAPR
jgi:uncharacterized OB-fold protein